ncbi:hypothetical protein GCM10027440_35530 [Nocardiopsis coralliicola]
MVRRTPGKAHRWKAAPAANLHGRQAFRQAIGRHAKHTPAQWVRDGTILGARRSSQRPLS